MIVQTPQDQAICAWYESQTEETLSALPGYEDGLTPRQAWAAFFSVCPPPVANTDGESLAALAVGGKGVDTSFYVRRIKRRNAVEFVREACAFAVYLPGIGLSYDLHGPAIFLLQESCIWVQHLAWDSWRCLCGAPRMTTAANRSAWLHIAAALDLHPNRDLFIHARRVGATSAQRAGGTRASGGVPDCEALPLAAINFGGCVAPGTACGPDGNHGDNFSGRVL